MNDAVGFSLFCFGCVELHLIVIFILCLSMSGFVGLRLYIFCCAFCMSGYISLCCARFG